MSPKRSVETRHMRNRDERHGKWGNVVGQATNNNFFLSGVSLRTPRDILRNGSVITPGTGRLRYFFLSGVSSRTPRYHFFQRYQLPRFDDRFLIDRSVHETRDRNRDEIHGK